MIFLFYKVCFIILFYEILKRYIYLLDYLFMKLCYNNYFLRNLVKILFIFWIYMFFRELLLFLNYDIVVFFLDIINLSLVF